ncbi:RHS repeat-associated core domain-containing protein [Jannaschia ovalis]|uniref:RHS repeat-associated core domain-containing protein n=1 Tax=Jannaschia ovalis TaxID=3038773 RepID=UPI0038B29B9D
MRDYDPTTGRYVQADPLGLLDGASVYGYALQSPMRWTDPKGEAVWGMCRPLDGALGYLPRGRHCAVFVTDDDPGDQCLQDGDRGPITGQFSLAAGDRAFDLEGTTPAYQRDRALFLGTVIDSRGRGTTIVGVRPPEGTSIRDFDDLVITNGNRFRRGRYNAVLGPNSNTAAENVIQMSGGLVTDLGAQAQKYGELRRYGDW